MKISGDLKGIPENERARVLESVTRHAAYADAIKTVAMFSFFAFLVWVLFGK